MRDLWITNTLILCWIFRELRRRHWNFRLCHVNREANFAEDYLANLGHSLSLSCHVFTELDASVVSWLRYDLLGVSQSRFVFRDIFFTSYK
ncbi:hypothetical protein LINPERPRIM_LOCUS34536 [Linum perenne]